MKNHMTRAFSLLIALLVLCAPIGAMAEETATPSVSLTLSNLSLSIGDEMNFNVDATARVDLGVNESGAIDGTLTLLAGADKALKGGFSFDMSALDLTAALEGVSTAVTIPLSEALETVQEQYLSNEQMAALAALYDAYMNLVNVAAEKGDVLTAAVEEKVSAWVNGVLTDGSKGEATVAVGDRSLTGQQYDYELTVQELMAIEADLFTAIQGDEELVAAIQSLVDAIMALVGEETIDISSLDMDAALAELEDVDTKIAGSLYTGETGLVLDINLISGLNEDETQIIPIRIAALADEEVYFLFSVDADREYGAMNLALEATRPADYTPKFKVTLTGAQESNVYAEDESTINSTGKDSYLFSIEGDFSDGISLTLNGEVTSGYKYDDETYESTNAFGLNYTGNVTDDENGVSLPGNLALYVNTDGDVATLSVDIVASKYNESVVSFDMPANVVNIFEADDETVSALNDEYMEVISNGLMILMGAPGMEDLASLFGGSEY